MNYPRLTDTQDRRRKLTDQDILDIQIAHTDALPFPTKSELQRLRAKGFDIQSETQWLREIAEMYGVGYAQVYVYTRDADWREGHIQRHRESQQRVHERMKQDGIPTGSPAEWHRERTIRGGAELREYQRLKEQRFRSKRERE